MYDLKMTDTIAKNRPITGTIMWDWKMTDSEIMDKSLTEYKDKICRSV